MDQGSSPSSRSETFRLLHAKNITRPQLKFKEKVDNSNTPFIPKIFIKPNAVKPLPSCKTCFLLSYSSSSYCFLVLAFDCNINALTQGCQTHFIPLKLSFLSVKRSLTINVMSWCMLLKEKKSLIFQSCPVGELILTPRPYVWHSCFSVSNLLPFLFSIHRFYQQTNA